MLEALRLPDLKGKTVLDIGTYDGFYAFEAERRGAARVVALDHYMWSFDVADVYAYYERCRAEGVVPTPYHEVEELWRPDELPGKRGFDTAHRLLESRVEPVVADFMDMNLADLGEFDVVLFLGVLYHLEDPVRALRRVGEVTRELAVIETEAVHLPGHENQPLFEFYPSNELNADVSNWWAPRRSWDHRATCRAKARATIARSCTRGSRPRYARGVSSPPFNKAVTRRSHTAAQ